MKIIASAVVVLLALALAGTILSVAFAQISSASDAGVVTGIVTITLAGLVGVGAAWLLRTIWRKNASPNDPR